MTVRSTCHVVGDEGASLPHWPRHACGRVLGRLQLELGINLGADQETFKRISTTVKEIMDHLADFGPRRWFRKVEPAEKKEDLEEAWHEEPPGRKAPEAPQRTA